MKNRNKAFTLLSLPAALFAANVHANHPVFVEGNCLTPPTGSNPPVAALGTCGDYDGDGRIGFAEDTDGDRVFGTINAALGPGTGASATFGANQNGRVVIVTSGTFAETVTITGANGNVTLEGAPGVEANIDAVLSGDPGNGARQGAPGIIVDAPNNRYITIRNIVSRNWTAGIDVRGASRVAIDECRLENNVNYGILASGRSRVKVDSTTVHGTGFRVGATGSAPSGPPPVITPAPGSGIAFEDNALGAIFRTEVSGSFATGISDQSTRTVRLQEIFLFDNNPGLGGFSPSVARQFGE